MSLTFVVREEQIDRDFTLQELQQFSKRIECKVIVKKFGIIDKGVITYLV